VSFTDALWGGILKSFAFNPVDHECVIEVAIAERCGTTTHVLLFSGVTELRFFSHIPSPWNYTEVTEVEAAFDEIAGCWRVEFMLWSEDTGLVLRCTQIFMDGRLQTI
jgi:hypothetical protein